MLILRIADGITSHFPARASEWAIAAGLTGWGAILLNPAISFTSPAYAIMQAMASEFTWGMGAVIVGSIGLLALIINGTFAHTKYGQYSPHIRALMAYLRSFILLNISLGLLASGEPTPDIMMYGAVFCLDIYNALRISGEAGEVDRLKSYAGA